MATAFGSSRTSNDGSSGPGAAPGATDTAAGATNTGAATAPGATDTAAGATNTGAATAPGATDTAAATAAAGAPRGPGRPPGATSAGGAKAAATRKRAEQQKRTRERAKERRGKPVSGGPRSSQTALDLKHLLFSLHLMGAAISKQPTLALTEDESAKLAAAISRVAEHYEVPMLDEKSRAWLALGVAGCEVYGTRIAAIVIEAKKRPHVVPPKQPAPAPVAPPIIIDQAPSYATAGASV